MKTIIIVEGKSDTRRLKEMYKQVVTFETSGLGLDENKINKLKKFEAEGAELICFTDPDYPGERIRQMLTNNLPSLKHAYVSRRHSRAKNGKIGIESATDIEIKKALDNVMEKQKPINLYDQVFMINNHLAGNVLRREMFCDKIGIAFGNNKKVIKQLNSFAIPESRVMKILEEIDGIKSEQ